MSSDVLTVYPCGCRIVRDDGGCGVHIQWCRLHENAGELLEAAALSFIDDDAEPYPQPGGYTTSQMVHELRATISRAGGCGE